MHSHMRLPTLRPATQNLSRKCHHWQLHRSFANSGVQYEGGVCLQSRQRPPSEPRRSSQEEHEICYERSQLRTATARICLYGFAIRRHRWSVTEVETRYVVAEGMKCVVTEGAKLYFSPFQTCQLSLQPQLSAETTVNSDINGRQAAVACMIGRPIR